MKNFGRNVRIDARTILYPATEKEVLAYLDKYRNHKIRAIGSLHSWSEVVAADDVVMDLRRMSGIRLSRDADGQPCAEIEAGCTIDAVLDYLEKHGLTLRTLGMIGKQTIAGAIATATHGSGRSSLSHYVTSVRVVGFDADGGKARIYEWGCGDQLLAAKCGLGYVGIVVALRMSVEPDCLIKEETAWYDSINEPLANAHAYPRQQFYLIPWSWKWFAQHRREFVPNPRETRVVAWLRVFRARSRRVLRLIAIDCVFNGAVSVASRWLRWWSAVRFLQRRVFPALTRMGTQTIDQSRHVLMMRHDLFRHVEMELFVPEVFVRQAAALVEWVLRRVAGESVAVPQGVVTPRTTGAEPEATALMAALSQELARLEVRYFHDQAITFRKVLRDETLISMTSGDAEAWYAISLITYQRDLTPFLATATFVAKSMAEMFQARPHWGKVWPLDSEQAAAIYPHLHRFRAACTHVDPAGVFLNDFAARVLGHENAARV